MKTQTGTAVVGLGVGMAHVAGYIDCADSTLVAVADAWRERRSRVGGTFEQGSMLTLRSLFDDTVLSSTWEKIGVQVFDDVRAVADIPQVGLVSLCTPDDTHETFGVMLLKAGKDLLLEKPVALSMESAGRLASAAAESGRRVAVGYEMRANPAILKMRSLLADGAIGEVHAFNLQQYRPPFRRDKWRKWIQQKSRSGGLIVEETCHWFDLARYLTGKEVVRVHCVATDRVHDDFDYEDIAFVQGHYADGAIFQIGHSLTGFDFSLIIQVHGRTGSIWCGMKADTTSLLDGGASRYTAIVGWGPADPGPGDAQYVTFGKEAREGESIRDNVMHTVRAVRDGSPFLADLDDGLRSLEIALAARTSLESGRPENVA